MSLSLPPSYPHLPGYASTSASSESASSSRTDSAHDPDRDKADPRSIASAQSASTTHSHISRSDTLKLAIHTDSLGKDHKVVRRAKCPPEFLEELARTGIPQGFKTRAECTFRVISGPEAETLFEQFVGELDAGDQEKSTRDLNRQYLSQPIVFAFSLLTAGRKVVDYYMTWRGKIPRARDRRGRRLSFLDSEFCRLSRSLDKHYKSLISVVDTSSLKPESTRLPDVPKHHEQPPKPPSVHEESPQSSDAASATASVVSLPLLNMIRNVPFGNRLPLRVTNPDTASILSDDTDTPALPPPILETIAEANETPTAAPLTESPTSAARPSETGRTDAGKSPKARHRLSSPKESPKRGQSSRSRTSPPDGETNPGTGDATPRSRENTKGSHSSRTRTSPLDEEKKSPSTGDERSKRRHSSHSHKHDDEHKHRNDDEASGKHSPRKHRRDRDKDKDKDKKDESDSDVASEFTIVLLDDNGEKDLLSWHGLNRTGVNSTPHSAITPTDSPWTGPLVNANKLIFHTRARQAHVHEPFFTDDEDADESEEEEGVRYEYEYGWPRHSPLVHHPKLFVDGPHQFASPAPSMPLPLTFTASTASNYSTASNASNYSIASTASNYSAAGTPASGVAFQTGYTYPVHHHHHHQHQHRPPPSPYVPAWIDPRHYDSPLTVMQTPLSYHTATPF